MRRLLLTNDDGIDAPGFEALRAATEGLGECVAVAPFGPYSGCGHVVTTHRPIPVVDRGGGRFAVEGTPADCVRLALHHLVPRFDWVVSGINAGGNLGSDVHHSGTVAAVREGVIHGKPGVALSQYMARGRPVDWGRSARWAARVLDDLLNRPWEPGTFWSVNFPHAEDAGPDPEVVFCPLDPSPLPLAYRLDGDGRVAHYAGDYFSRARVAGSDVAVCFGGKIAVTLVRVS